MNPLQLCPQRFPPLTLLPYFLGAVNSPLLPQILAPWPPSSSSIPQQNSTRKNQKIKTNPSSIPSQSLLNLYRKKFIPSNPLPPPQNNQLITETPSVFQSRDWPIFFLSIAQFFAAGNPFVSLPICHPPGQQPPPLVLECLAYGHNIFC